MHTGFGYVRPKERDHIEDWPRFVCGLFNDAFHSSDYTASNCRMNEEMGRLWKEVVVTCFKVLAQK
jgi:hypothetical protein